VVFQKEFNRRMMHYVVLLRNKIHVKVPRLLKRLDLLQEPNLQQLDVLHQLGLQHEHQLGPQQEHQLGLQLGHQLGLPQLDLLLLLQPDLLLLLQPDLLLLLQQGLQQLDLPHLHVHLK
jgi:hypothetical protein